MVTVAVSLVPAEGTLSRVGPSELRHQSRQGTGRRGRDPRSRDEAAAMRGVVPQRLDERLIWPDRLLVAAPTEDDAAGGVHVGGESRCQPCLADAGLAGHDHEPGCG